MASPRGRSGRCGSRPTAPFIGSYGGGLGILRGGALRRLTRREGLDDDVVSAILDDGRGVLWLHGNRGLTRLLRSDLEAWMTDPSRRVDVRRWATPEGNGGGQPAGVVMRDGSLALPTVAGLVRMDPRQLRDVLTIPSLTLLHAEIDGMPLTPGAELEVPAGPGRVELEFTAAILRHPELAAFEYRVTSEADGEPEVSWHRVADDRRIQWAGFPAGRHRIELRVANESGVYSPTTTLRFVLAQAWHERWSVRVSILLAVVALGAAVALWRMRLARAYVAGLQREIDQRLAVEAEARSLARRLEEAERLEAVGRLAGGIAHDFNTLFAAIRGATSMIASAPADGSGPSIDEPVRTLDACVDRGARLTGQLLSFARLQHLDADAFDLCERLGSIEPAARALLPPGLTLHVSRSSSPLYVLADAAALELAVLSLVRNAAEALAKNGTIAVRVFEEDGATARRRWPDLPGSMPPSANAPPESWVVLEVEDDGAGIPPERLSKVLEPFYSTRTGGAGLGLPSALGFALQSGGTLRLASVPGTGTRVALILPRVPAPRGVRDTAAAAATPKVAVTHRIVVVDDDELVGSAIAMILRRAGHQTAVYRDPRAALEDLRAGIPCDVLVSDILMPGLTGSELADEVLAARPGTPILFVSGFTRDVDASRLPGALLAKPFRSDEVLAAVETAIARAVEVNARRRGA
jgi:signal transduction histidine kinase/ActR/RegA family two-component response regulator